MIRMIKTMFSKGRCENCGWLVACPECSERMRQVDRELTIIERAHARRKEPRYCNQGRPLKGRFDGLVDKGSFMEVLQQVLHEHQGEAGGSLMLTVTMTASAGDQAIDWQLVLQEVAPVIVSQLRHEDFVTCFDDRTFALLFIESGEELLEPEAVVHRIQAQLTFPGQAAEPSMQIAANVRRICLAPGTTLENILQQMNS